MADFFGDQAESSPPWFKPSSFLDPSFDPETYLSSLRSFVTLESLSKELRAHLSALKAELVDLVNRDYADFVSLSTRLGDPDSAVARMRVPIAKFRDKVDIFRSAVGSALENLEDGLRQRAEAAAAAAAREVLELLLDTFHVVSKHRENVTNLKETQSILLERIANEMNRLKFYISHAENLPFIKSMEKRIQNATFLLDGSLRHCFVDALEHQDANAIYSCLRAYAAIDNTSAAEEFFEQLLWHL